MTNLARFFSHQYSYTQSYISAIINSSTNMWDKFKLLDLIEYGNEEQRYHALKKLKNKRTLIKQSFRFLENLLISDLNPNIRMLTSEILVLNQPSKALKSIQWAIKNDSNIKCAKFYLNLLEYFPENFSKQFLFNEIMRMRLKFERYQSENNVMSFKDISIKNLVDYYLNYRVLDSLITKYPNITRNQLKIEMKEGKIVNLRISNQKIRNMEEIEEIFLLDSLEQLDLSYNEINKVNGIESLFKLRYLDLSHNKIENAQDIGVLIELRHLDLGFNNINEFDDLKKLKKLEYLNLMNNSLKGIKNIDCFQSIETLNLSKNQISGIKGFEKLKNLSIIDLSMNDIRDIDKYINYKERFSIELLGNPFKYFNVSL